MTTETAATPPPGLLAPLRTPDFRLLWIGIGTSGLGDQFTYVALPWLALQLTGDELFVGLVRTMIGLAMALFMLLGGAVSDRFSPRRMMLLSNAALFGIALLIALMVLTETINAPLLLLVAFLFGMCGAFFEPAYYAVFPRMLPSDQLNAGNSLMTLTFQLGSIIGPGIAGAIIAAFGVAFAFGIDALTFGIAVIAILLMRPTPAQRPDDTQTQTGLFATIREGIAYAFADEQLRALMILLFLLNGVLTPSLGVGMTILADARFGMVEALGWMLSGMGVGAVTGTALAGTRYLPGALGWMLAGAVALLGSATLLLGFVSVLWGAVGCMTLVGFAIGLTNVRVMAWIQKRVPPDRLGRVMSLIMFSAVSLQPIGYTVAGLLARWSLPGLLFGSGSLLLLMSLYTLARPALRQMRTV